VFQYLGLQRRLNTAQDLYLTLLREFETARIEEVNDTPVLTVIDSAIPPRRKSHPRRILIAGVATSVAFALAVLLAMMSNYLEEARQISSADYVNLRSSWVKVQSELRALVGRGRAAATGTGARK